MSNLVDLNKKFLKLNADQQKLKQSVLNMNNSGFAGFNEFKSHSKGETEYKDGLDYETGDFAILNHKIPPYNVLGKHKEQRCADSYRDHDDFKYTDKRYLYDFGFPKYPNGDMGGADPPLDVYLPTKIAGLPDYYDKIQQTGVKTHKAINGENTTAPPMSFYGKYSRRFEDGDYSHYSNYYLGYNPNYKVVRAKHDLTHDYKNAKTCSYQPVRFHHPMGSDSYYTTDNMTSRISTDQYYNKDNKKNYNMHDRYNIPEVFSFQGRNVSKNYMNQYLGDTGDLRRLQMSLVRKRLPYPFKVQYR
jgi:hypothetical protein